MILGRPTNLWLGLTTAIGAAVSGTALVLGADPAIVAALVTGWSGVLGSVIVLVAGQAPTLAVGDAFNIQTPPGQPNFQSVVAMPPAASRPVPDPDDGK